MSQWDKTSPCAHEKDLEADVGTETHLEEAHSDAGRFGDPRAGASPPDPAPPVIRPPCLQNSRGNRLATSATAAAGIRCRFVGHTPPSPA